MLVLSLFPGIGLLDMAFEEEGFTVVRGPDVLWGGDIRKFHPPTDRFDGIIGGPPCQMFSALARLVEANGCKTRFGNLIPEFERCVVEAQPSWFVMENVEAAPVPVIDGYGIHSFTLDNSMLDSGDGHGHEQRRLRRFSFGRRGLDSVNLMRWIDLAVFVLPDASRAHPVTGGHDSIDNLNVWSKEKKTRAVAVTSTDGGIRPSERKRSRAVSSSAGGLGPGRPEHNASQTKQGRYRLPDACRLQGLPEGFLSDAPFTADGKLKAVANGVPIPMGRAIAKAVIESTRVE